ncbi:hypothetical protein HALLA_17350 [Halostagnicola larsenii XH-48]|uniref:DUF7344 domain-containing protein n=1 Tax=Halostagnicola larsenii XH-48 TaxID=797299 RepID=W0JVN0_9EURY|nr:hypothetical protein HALLA_17350 [Halostagnicola larsenii XH-48]
MDLSYTDVANRYRRQTLSILADERPLSVSELASRIVAHPSNDATNESTETQVRKARLALYHVHLPKLDESGLVSYTHETGEVTVPEGVADDLAEIAETFRSQMDE